MSEGIVTIKQGREKPIRQQHPWIFSGAIASALNAQPGDIVTVVAHDGTFLARGYWNPKSQIQVRILTWHDEPIDEAWWRRMLQRAIDGRAFRFWESDQFDDGNAYRVVNAENDFLPGLIIDRYGDWYVLQALTLGIDMRKHQLATLFAELVHPAGIYERSDVDVRGKEGLKTEVGTLWGDNPPKSVIIEENSLNLEVDIYNGHKTGFYLDQRENRNLLMQHYAMSFAADQKTSVLNLFSYTGAFGSYLLSVNAGHITNVDASHDALEIAERNLQLNNQSLERAEFIQADVFEYIRDAVERGERYDVIVCDPPKFAHNAQQVDRAARGYKDLNLHSFKLLKPGGHLMTFSCSGAISADLFQKIVFGALADSGRQAQILKHLGPGDDHPVALTFPEGAYLKGLLLRVY